MVVTLLAGLVVAVAQSVLPASGRAWSVRVLVPARCCARPASACPHDDVRLAVRPAITGTLVAANHVSWLDVPAVLAVEPMRVLAKTDVRRWPVIGLLAAAGGSIFLDRDRLRTLPTTVAEVAGALGRGESVLVFPEGTTRCGRVQGRFYPAMFQAAIDAGALGPAGRLRYRLADGTPTTVAAFVGAGHACSPRCGASSPPAGWSIEVDAGPVAHARRWRPAQHGRRHRGGHRRPPRLHAPLHRPPQLPGSCGHETPLKPLATTSPKLWPGAAYDRT